MDVGRSERRVHEGKAERPVFNSFVSFLVQPAGHQPCSRTCTARIYRIVGGNGSKLARAVVKFGVSAPRAQASDEALASVAAQPDALSGLCGVVPVNGS